MIKPPYLHVDAEVAEPLQEALRELLLVALIEILIAEVLVFDHPGAGNTQH